MLKNFFKVVLGTMIIVLLGGLGACTSITSTLNPNVTQRNVLTLTKDTYSNNIILENLSAEKTLVSKNASQRIHIASLTKMMTAYILIEESPNLLVRVKIKSSVIEKMRAENATNSGFSPNESVKLLDLAYGIMLPSGGDAAIMAADYISGGETRFVALMNEYADKLKLDDTNFTNASGLDTAGQYSTVADLKKLLNHALKEAVFKQIFTSLNYHTQPYEQNPAGYEINSTLVNQPTSLKLQDGVILGGKTGFTDLAGYCLASLARIRGQEYLLITAGAPEVKGKSTHISDAVTIYNEISKL